MRPVTALRLGAGVAIALGLVWTVRFATSGPGPGRPARGPAAPQARAARDAPPAPSELLEGIGYADLAEPDPAGEDAPTGVRRHLAGRPAPGLTLFCPGAVSEARLLTLDGERVHTWSDPDGERGVAWQHAELLPDGGLLVISEFESLERYDWNSRRLWRTEIAAHHDLDLDAQGNIVMLTAEPRRVEIDGQAVPILDNAIAVLDLDGRPLLSVPLSELFARVPRYLGAYNAERMELLTAFFSAHADDWGQLMLEDRKAFHDLFHANSLEVLEREVPGVARPGDLLISVRNLSTLAFVRLDPPRLLAHFGQRALQEQHHASLLSDGRVLVFDNGVYREQSRVLELDPRSGFVLRAFDGGTAGPLYTKRRGGVQATGAGGLLVSISGVGRALEFDAAGELVWEYVCPPEPDGSRRPVYRYERIAPERARRLPFDPPLTDAQLGLGP